MKRPEIIELATALTERKGEKVLPMNSLYAIVLQDICKREHFWWRRVLVNFALTANTNTYDLTNATLFPSLAEIAIDEITKFSLILSPSPLQTAELVPVFDPETLIEMTFGTQQVSPARYTIDANGYTVLRIDPPDKAYTAFIVGWGIANPATDSTNDAVPLIPAWGHNTVVDGLIVKIWEFVYGVDHPKTLAAVKRYEQGIQDLAQRKKFDPNYSLQLSLSEHAVQST